MKINDQNFAAACDYLQKQLATRSWWPREQPGLAKQEFKQMQGNAVSLNIWCEKWLDGGQCRQLEKAIERKG